MNLILPSDGVQGTLVGRLYDPEQGGPCVIGVWDDEAIDLTPEALTMADLTESTDPLELIANAKRGKKWSLEKLLENGLAGRWEEAHLLAPCDLQVIKACGVTFARSMLERVIEERAKGNPGKAASIRRNVTEVVGGALSAIKAGSPEAARVKELLIKEEVWSQYLEVGIGPDAEVFTKAPLLSAVGLGSKIGVLEKSRWNNPEPEVVLAVNSRGQAVGATLGNDVNLRDIEGRSALLLGKAKDNNASCAIGPFLRLFDSTFSLDDVRGMEINLRVTGRDGFVLNGRSSMKEISRDPLELVSQTVGKHHQYPDGIMLFMGTLFAPTEDRDLPGEGFTHKPGDLVEIWSNQLGRLSNAVTFSDEAPPWIFGVRSLMRNLASRGLLTRYDH